MSRRDFDDIAQAAERRPVQNPRMMASGEGNMSGLLS